LGISRIGRCSYQGIHIAFQSIVIVEHAVIGNIKSFSADFFPKFQSFSGKAFISMLQIALIGSLLLIQKVVQIPKRIHLREWI
jgi:hypothetical protein